jgi:hypothetical protein
MSWEAMMSAFVDGFAQSKFLEVNWGGVRRFRDRNRHFSPCNMLIVV